LYHIVVIKLKFKIYLFDNESQLRQKE